MLSIKRVVDSLVYLSIVLGIVLLAQLYFLVPSWLFYSVLIGWLAYSVVALLIATGHRLAYLFAFLLSILTLVVSLPQPEHYAFISERMWLATLTFAAGSVLQIALLILIPVYLLRTRRTKKL